MNITRAVAQQVLTSRGLLPADLPDFTTEKGQDELKRTAASRVTSYSLSLTSHHSCQALNCNCDTLAKDMNNLRVHKLTTYMYVQCLFLTGLSPNQSLDAAHHYAAALAEFLKHSLQNPATQPDAKPAAKTATSASGIEPSAGSAVTSWIKQCACILT